MAVTWEAWAPSMAPKWSTNQHLTPVSQQTLRGQLVSADQLFTWTNTNVDKGDTVVFSVNVTGAMKAEMLDRMLCGKPNYVFNWLLWFLNSFQTEVMVYHL